MGETEKGANAGPVKIKKKSKNMSNDQMDDNRHVELDNDVPKKKDHKHKEKKRKSETNEDQRGYNGNLEESEHDSQKKHKKRKRDSSENNHSSEMNENAIKEDFASKDGNFIKEKKTKSFEKPKSKDKSKRVSFSGKVEVFPCSDDPQKSKGDGLIRGKRFTPEEDEIVKEAVHNYITTRGLGEEGLKMVLNCQSHKGMKKCWQEIGTCIPYRPYIAIYYRAHILFERAETRKWTPQEIELLKENHEKYGNNWKKLGEELGKHRIHVKDTWRRIKPKERKGGKWSQEEYQNLYDLVNKDLQLKATEKTKKSKHGMLRDNIPWGVISDKLSTRSDATCCDKWYNQLTSSLVVEKKWSDADDYRLIGALYEVDAACVDDVDWDNLLEHRSGDVCLKRWNQMVRHIGHFGSESFADQVDTLAKRYCPDLAETRQDWDDKPTV